MGVGGKDQQLQSSEAAHSMVPIYTKCPEHQSMVVGTGSCWGVWT